MEPEFLRSELLDDEHFRHGFFTRRGGRSKYPFDSLHFGASGQSAEELAANVAAAAGALQVSPARLYVVTQVHGRDVAVVRGNEPRQDLLSQRADVVLSSSPGVACGVKIADCVPVLLADRQSGATAAIHSGWQGTVANVVAAGVAALRCELGREGKLLAAIGPHIEACCFEVGEDVAAKLEKAAPGSSVVRRDRGNRPRVDLRTIVRLQLLACGLDDQAIDDVSGCTKCDGARFFSHRRDGVNSGRLLAAIVCRGSSNVHRPSGSLPFAK